MPPETTDATDLAALADLRAREITAAEAGDVEALLELRFEDFVAMPPGHPPVEGIENVRPFLQGMFAQVEIQLRGNIGKSLRVLLDGIGQPGQHPFSHSLPVAVTRQQRHAEQHGHRS